MKWYERLGADHHKYYGPIGFVHSVRKNDGLAVIYDEWMYEWDKTQNWLECLLTHTEPENTVKLLLKLEIYPKRTIKVVDKPTEIFCHYKDLMFFNEQDIISNNLVVRPIDPLDWKALVKAKSNTHDVWND